MIGIRFSTRNHELLMHSHLFAAARGLLASGEQVIDVTSQIHLFEGGRLARSVGWG